MFFSFLFFLLSRLGVLFTLAWGGERRKASHGNLNQGSGHHPMRRTKERFMASPGSPLPGGSFCQLWWKNDRPLVVKHSLRGSPIFSQKVAKRHPWFLQQQPVELVQNPGAISQAGGSTKGIPPPAWPNILPRRSPAVYGCTPKDKRAHSKPIGKLQRTYLERISYCRFSLR